MSYEDLRNESTFFLFEIKNANSWRTAFQGEPVYDPRNMREKRMDRIKIFPVTTHD